MDARIMIEEKHRFKQGVIMRNRAYATLIPGEVGSEVPREMVAKGSVSVPSDCADKNEFMVNLYLHRRPGQKTLTHPFVSVREQWINARDVTRETREVALNLEPDFKRRPFNASMIDARDGQHIAYETVPWDSLEQALMVRNHFDAWRTMRCMKTKQDFDDFEDRMLCALTFEALRKNGVKVPVKITQSGSPGVLQRMFLRGYVQDQLDMDRSQTYQEVADIFTSLGCDTSRDDVKNAGRAKFYPRIVPITPRVKDMLVDLKFAFKSLSLDNLLAPFEV